MATTEIPYLIGAKTITSMKRVTRIAFLLVLVAVFTAAAPEPVPLLSSELTAGMEVGTPEVGSMDKLAFGPEGILFIGDSKKAKVLAVDTRDNESRSEGAELNLEDFDGKLAAALGTTPDQVEVKDLAVNPVSKNVYLSVSTMDGQSALLRLKGETLEAVPLSEVPFSEIELQDAIGADAEDGRGRPLRVWAISDLMFHNGKVLVSGLSNKEFGSTFRSIPFPFESSQTYASLEIWHAAHGQYETHAPIKTFTVTRIAERDYLLASYTCTPLVLFPLDELKAGEHRKGRTVAELGAGNSPLDMAWIEKDGKKYFLMSNSNRPVMRIPYEAIATTQNNMTEPVEEFAVSDGLDYVSVPMVHVLQMDVLDAGQLVYLQRMANGDLVLRTRSFQWI